MRCVSERHPALLETARANSCKRTSLHSKETKVSQQTLPQSVQGGGPAGKAAAAPQAVAKQRAAPQKPPPAYPQPQRRQAPAAPRPEPPPVPVDTGPRIIPGADFVPKQQRRRGAGAGTAPQGRSGASCVPGAAASSSSARSASAAVHPSPPSAFASAAAAGEEWEVWETAAAFAGASGSAPCPPHEFSDYAAAWGYDAAPVASPPPGDYPSAAPVTTEQTDEIFAALLEMCARPAGQPEHDMSHESRMHGLEVIALTSDR